MEVQEEHKGIKGKVRPEEKSSLPRKFVISGNSKYERKCVEVTKMEEKEPKDKYSDMQRQN